MTAALLALCACGAAVPAVLESDTPPETSVSPSAVASETPTPEPTDAPTPTPPVTPEPTEEPTPSRNRCRTRRFPRAEEVQRTLYETNSYCAALYLGRSSAASLSDALPELLAQKGLDSISYLADIAASACVEQPGDEVFILIPRGDKVLSLYNYVLETQSDCRRLSRRAALLLRRALRRRGALQRKRRAPQRPRGVFRSGRRTELLPAHHTRGRDSSLRAGRVHAHSPLTPFLIK